MIYFFAEHDLILFSCRFRKRDQNDFTKRGCGRHIKGERRGNTQQTQTDGRNITRRDGAKGGRRRESRGGAQQQFHISYRALVY